MTEKLRISAKIALPVEAVTQTFVVFGKRGSGKSNAAVVLAEEMQRIGARWVALDPVGHWWGLKAKGDGAPGLSVYVFGGPHADLPLEPTAGALMADVAVETAKPIVLCMREFSGQERARFVADFAERLLKRNQTPLHVFLEEADAFAPQSPFKGEERMVGAVDKMVRWGRQQGIGVTAITQRSAKIKKDITTQAEVLVAFRTLGPQDRDAIDAWIKYHEAGARRQEVLESLATLSDGESWLWSPEWLDFFGRVQWRRRETFDAAATPKVGERVVQPKLADVDLEQLRGKMAATIERAKADDPRELRRRIAELEKERAQERAHPLMQRVEVPVVERVEIPVLSDEVRKELREQIHEIRVGLQTIQPLLSGILNQLARVTDRPLRLKAEESRGGSRVPAPQPESRAATTVAAAPPPPSQNGHVANVSAPQQRILDALARLESVRVSEALKTQVALFAGASPSSSAYTNNLGTLRTAGLIDYPRPGRVSLTEVGRRQTGAVEVPVSTAELQEQVAVLIGATRWRILKALIDRYPKAIEKAELAQLAEASPTSSAYTNNLGALRSLGFLDYPTPGYVAAEAVLFVEEAMVAAGGHR